MADTKKEHYVPRCYLNNFVHENDKIQVFDKYKMQVRQQKIMEVAMENYFYDINFDDLLKKAEAGEEEKIKADIMKSSETDDWNEILEILDEKHIEKQFSFIEGFYSNLLKLFIRKSHNGHQWEIQNCYAFSARDKELMSLFISIQIIRTKAFRDTLTDTIQKMYQTLAYKSQMDDKDALPKEVVVASILTVIVKVLITDEDEK